jgi:hypothetical protein
MGMLRVKESRGCFLGVFFVAQCRDNNLGLILATVVAVRGDLTKVLPFSFPHLLFVFGGLRINPKIHELVDFLLGVVTGRSRLAEGRGIPNARNLVYLAYR